jgi:hypothetical protein
VEATNGKRTQFAGGPGGPGEIRKAGGRACQTNPISAFWSQERVAFPRFGSRGVSPRAAWAFRAKRTQLARHAGKSEARNAKVRGLGMSNEPNLGVFGPGTPVATRNKANPWRGRPAIGDWGLRIGDSEGQWCERSEQETQNKANSGSEIASALRFSQ